MAEYSQKWHNGTSRSRSTETSDGLADIQAQLNNLGREIKKVNEKVYAAQVGCEQCKGPHYTKDCPLQEEGKTLEEAYYTQFGGPFQGGGYRAAAPGFYHRNNANPSKEKDLGSFTLPCFINNECFDNALVDLGASISVMPLLTYLNLGLGELAHTKLTVELADRTVIYPKGIAENVLVGIGKFVFRVDFIILDMHEDIKVPLILRRLFLSIARAKIDVYKRKITLRIGEERIMVTSVKPASSLIKKVYMLSLKERMELDLEDRLMGETLLRRNQGDDLMPTIKEGEVIKEFRTRDDELDAGIDDYPSCYDYDKKIHIDCAHNLKFSRMIGFEFMHANFFSLLYVNVMSKKFHNSIMKDKMVYKGNNVIGVLMNVPIFVGTFSVVTDFVVLEDMDAYRDEGIGGVIFSEPFFREVEIKTRRFEGMITIYNSNDEVTYQMVRSHSRFKHHTNEQCNKIPPLLTVSDKDKNNGISHPYQKLKGFYKGVLKLGSDYIRDARMEEWLIRRHINVHEME
ncbi:putative reverse transcriptase domain-containing protein [Tanacetum coccineum]